METIVFIFLITRFLFLSDFPHFFDSPEYLKLSQEASLSSALQKSHESIHPIYLFLIQTTHKLFNFINFTNFITPLSFLSAFFGLLTFICFYFLVKRLFNQKTARLSLIPLIFFPHLWLIQTNILHEAVDHFFMIASLLFFDIFLTNKKILYTGFSLLFLLLALVNFPGNLIWLPIYSGIFIFRKYKK